MGLRVEVKPSFGEQSTRPVPKPPDGRLNWFEANFPHFPSIQEVTFRVDIGRFGTRLLLAASALYAPFASSLPAHAEDNQPGVKPEGITIIIDDNPVEISGIQAGGEEPAESTGQGGGGVSSPDTAIAFVDERRNLIKTRPDGTIETLITVTGLDSGPRNIELNTKNSDGSPKKIPFNQFYPPYKTFLTGLLSENGKKSIPEEIEVAQVVKVLTDHFGTNTIDIHIANSLDELGPESPSFMRIRQGEYTGQNLFWVTDDIVQGDTPDSKVIRSAIFFNPDLPANLNLPDSYRQGVVYGIYSAIGFGLFQAKTSQPGDQIMIVQGNQTADLLVGIFIQLGIVEAKGLS